jgi:hypothetical protein
MKNCEQMKGLSVYEHGISVHEYYLDLKNHILSNNTLNKEWKIPEWAFDKTLWDQIESDEVISNYQIFHDCGKPYCLTIDKDGRKHFPEHANVSFEIWKNLNQSELEADLMLHDMDIHLLRGGDIERFCELPYASTLLLTGLCEIHSNAQMFGGIDSTSFKIKLKNIKKFGRRILENLKEQQKEASM